ncbi:MAG: DUF1249 domain-containing protein [Cellvibrionaceae bacterium]
MARLRKRYVVNFPGHMADCEFNYRRLRRLMPGWAGMEQKVSADTPINHDEIGHSNHWPYIVGNIQGNHTSSEMALTIDVIDRAKYTTTVHIVVYSRLQSQISWVKQQNSEVGEGEISYKKQKFTVADKALQAKMSPNGSKAYSLDVRLYHDAAVAEVIAWQGHRRFQVRHEYPNRNMYQRDEKAQLNTFLGELLEFCLAQGRVMQNIVTV